MKKLWIVSALVPLVMALALLAAPAVAQNVTVFTGTVTINGAPAPAGTTAELRLQSSTGPLIVDPGTANPNPGTTGRTGFAANQYRIDIQATAALEGQTVNLVVPGTSQATQATAVLASGSVRIVNIVATTTADSIATVLAPLGSNLVRIWGFDPLPQCFRVHDPASALLSDLTVLKQGEGYWINVKSAQKVILGSYEYNLSAGWNLKGWLGPSGLESAVPKTACGQQGSGPPHRFGGTATLDGKLVDAGVKVSAWIDGKEVGTATTTAGGNYVIDVAQPEGASYAGKTVNFLVAGAGGPATPTGTWAFGGVTELNLTVVVTQPVPAATTLAPLINTGHLVLVTSFKYTTALYEAFVPNLPGNVLTEIRPNSVIFITLTHAHTVVVSGVSFPIKANTPTPVPVGATVTITLQ